MKSFLIKVNGSYYAGEHEDTTPIPRPTDGWYANRGESNVIFFMNDKTNAKICDGLINLNSHWQRIYNAMKYDGLEVTNIEIEVIGDKEEKKKLMLPMFCNKCGKEPEKEKKDGWNVMKLDCPCGGRVVMDYTKPYYE